MTYMSVVTISDLPSLNASLNAISTVFISLGWYRIRRGHWQQHVACMIAAIITSTLFLASYVTYHVARGGQATKFSGVGLVRPIYFVILITHVLLAFAIVPMVIVTLVPTLPKTLGQTSPHWEMDHADLALCFRYGRACLPDALPVVAAD